MLNLKLVDNTELPLPTDLDKAARLLADSIRTSGRVKTADGKKLDWQDFANRLLKDTVSVSHIRPLLTTSIQMILREPLEPMIQIVNLFDRIEAKGLESRVIGGVIGAVTADDVAEGSQYPEVSFQLGGGLQTAYIGKSGLQVSFTDEALRYSTWDLMSLNLRQMRNALIRHKEQKAVAFLKTYGTEYFNNLSPSTSIYGVTTGRGLDMAANGSVIMDDLFKTFTHMVEEGFTPDYMLMHPKMYMMWIQDPVLRDMMIAHGGGTWYQRWNGNPGPTDPWSNGAIGAAGPSMGNRMVPAGSPSGETPTGIVGREHGMTSTPTVPPYFPWLKQIVVSPFVPFDADTELSDVYFLSSGNVGLHLVDEDPITVEWKDEEKEITKLRIRERYGFHVSNEGMGIGVMKNIPFKRNYWDGTIAAHTLDVINEIEADADLRSVL